MAVVILRLLLAVTATLLHALTEGGPVQQCRLKPNYQYRALMPYSTEDLLISCNIVGCSNKAKDIRWKKDGKPILFSSDGATIEGAGFFSSPHLGLKAPGRVRSNLKIGLMTPQLSGNYTCHLCDSKDNCSESLAEATVTYALEQISDKSGQVLQLMGAYPPEDDGLQLDSKKTQVYLSRKCGPLYVPAALTEESTVRARLVVVKSTLSDKPSVTVRWLQEYNFGRKLIKPRSLDSASVSLDECQPDDLGYYRLAEKLKNRLHCFKATLKVKVDRDTVGQYSLEVDINGVQALKLPPFISLELPSRFVDKIHPEPVKPVKRPDPASRNAHEAAELLVPRLSFATNTSKCAGDSIVLECRITPKHSRVWIQFLPAVSLASGPQKPIVLQDITLDVSLRIGSLFVQTKSRKPEAGIVVLTLSHLTLNQTGWYSCGAEVLDKAYERWPKNQSMHLGIVPTCYGDEVKEIHNAVYISVGVVGALLLSIMLSVSVYVYYAHKRRTDPIVKRLRIVCADNSELYMRNRQQGENSNSPLLGRSSYYRQESNERPGGFLTVPEVIVERIGPRGGRLFGRWNDAFDNNRGVSEANREVRYIIPTCQVFEVDRKRIVMIGRIGQGAFGTVHSAQYVQSNGATRDVAVKTLKRDHTQEEIIALVKEMEVMKRMHKNPHPNIVQLVGVCTTKGPFLLLVELAHHGNLRDFLKQRKVTNAPADYVNVVANTREICFMPCIQPAQLLQFSQDVARALQFMTEMKIVHRDIAARNILVSNADGADAIVAKVADFGLTRNLDDKDYYRVITEGKLPVKWLAPESLRSRIFSTKSDVWAYGVLLYEIFSKGETPYPGVSPSAVLPFLEAGGFNPRPQFAGPELYSLMLDCWAWEPRDRPNFENILARLAHIEALY